MVCGSFCLFLAAVPWLVGRVLTMHFTPPVTALLSQNGQPGCRLSPLLGDRVGISGNLGRPHGNLKRRLCSGDPN